MNKLSRVIPILGWLPSYHKEWLRYDLVAGMTAAAVVIPKAMAYAAIAGLPLVVGLYTSLVPLVGRLWGERMFISLEQAVGKYQARLGAAMPERVTL